MYTRWLFLVLLKQRLVCMVSAIGYPLRWGRRRRKSHRMRPVSRDGSEEGAYVEKFPGTPFLRINAPSCGLPSSFSIYFIIIFFNFPQLFRRYYLCEYWMEILNSSIVCFCQRPNSIIRLRFSKTCRQSYTGQLYTYHYICFNYTFRNYSTVSNSTSNQVVNLYLL